MRSFDNVIYKVGKFRTQKLLGWCHLKRMDISVGSFTQFGNFAPSGGFDHAIYKVWKFSTHICIDGIFFLLSLQFLPA